MIILRGVVYMHSETGTEGCYWAFQDEKFMNLAPPKQWRCGRCGRIWDKDKHPDEEPKASFSYWIDREVLTDEQNPKNYMTGYMAFDEPQSGTLIDPATGVEFVVSESPEELDRKLTHTFNETARQCFEQGHGPWESPQKRYPTGTWSYKGLHILKNGDLLTIYNKDRSDIVWHGAIQLDQHELFSEDASGMWIHADQHGIDRDTWSKYFFDERPADLEVKA